MLNALKDDNVVQLNNENTKIYDMIKMFLTNKGYGSQSTLDAYKNDLTKFFVVVKGKEINYLTEDDVQITLDDFEKYIAKMHRLKKYNSKTINRTVKTTCLLLKYLYSKKVVKDIGYILANEIPKLKETKNRYHAFTLDEVFELAELARQEKEKGEIKYYLILFALDTCIRLSALLNIKWTDLKIEEDGVLVEAIDKGNKEYRPKISKEFYNELLSLKTEGCGEFVFNISKQGVNRMMIRLLGKMEGVKGRKLVFHSIRKTGGTFDFRRHGDILHTQKVLNHSDPSVTQDYIAHQEYGITGAVSSKSEVETDIFEAMTREELLKLIRNSNKQTQLILALKAKELFEL